MTRKENLITPCGKVTNSHGKQYDKQSWYKHVESCHSQECREYMAKIRATAGHQDRYYLPGDPR